MRHFPDLIAGLVKSVFGSRQRGVPLRGTTRGASTTSEPQVFDWGRGVFDSRERRLGLGAVVGREAVLGREAVDGLDIKNIADFGVRALVGVL